MTVTIQQLDERIEDNDYTIKRTNKNDEVHKICKAYNQILKEWRDDLIKLKSELKKELQRLQNKYDVVPMDYVFNSIDNIFDKTNIADKSAKLEHSRVLGGVQDK